MEPLFGLSTGSVSETAKTAKPVIERVWHGSGMEGELTALRQRMAGSSLDGQLRKGAPVHSKNGFDDLIWWKKPDNRQLDKISGKASNPGQKLNGIV